MKPLYVGYFTPRYEPDARALVDSLKAFNLEYHIAPVPDLGSWILNCGYKPTFIRNMMLRHEGRPIVYLDADARLRKAPVLFDGMGDADFAAHWKDGHELLSGTLYFGISPHAWKLVQDWIEGCAVQPREWDQKILQGIVQNHICDIQSEMMLTTLPASYTAIFDAGMCAKDEIVVEHMQASRRLKVG